MKATGGERIVVIGWGMLTFIVVGMASTFNTALPTIADELRLRPAESAWLVSLYTLTFAIATVVFARMSDRYTITKLLLAGLIVGGASSVAGMFVNDYAALFIVRLLQAIGGGSLPGLSFIYFKKHISEGYRSTALMQLAIFIGLGFGLGPILGGGIAYLFGWRTLFALPALLLFAIPIASRLGAGDSGLRTLKTKPVMRALLMRQSYTLRIVMQFGLYFVQMSVLYLIPMQAESLSYSAIEIGWLLTPGALCATAILWRIGKLPKEGRQDGMMIGLLSVIAGAVVLAAAGEFPIASVLIGYFFVAIGLAVASASLNDQIARRLNAAEASRGLALSQFIQFLGGATGAAVSGNLLDRFRDSYALLDVGLACVATVTAVAYILLNAKEKSSTIRRVIHERLT
ncbi:MAG: MFS transporter [Cohnella sp.]|nr:MFS transporter [Cohnella sp.]